MDTGRGGQEARALDGRARFGRAVERRRAEIAATIAALVRERAVVEEHRRLVVLGAMTPEVALASLRARGVDVSPLVLHLSDPED